LFFNFAVSFDFGCCSLAQEMSFVGCYLPYFRQWLITSLLSALFLFSPCLLNVLKEISSFHLPPSLVHLQHPAPLLCVPFQFIVYLLFCGVGGQSAQGAMLVYPGVAGGILHDAWCSSVGLVDVSQAGLELAVVAGGRPPAFSV
jgi:hypothetical protein